MWSQAHSNWIATNQVSILNLWLMEFANFLKEGDYLKCILLSNCGMCDEPISSVIDTNRYHKESLCRKVIHPNIREFPLDWKL